MLYDTNNFNCMGTCTIIIKCVCINVILHQIGCSILRMQLDVIKGCRSLKSASAISFWLGNTFLLITNAATDISIGGISETITPFTVYICAPPTRSR